VGTVHEHHVHPNHITSLSCSSFVSLTGNGSHRDRNSFLLLWCELPPCWPEFSTENKLKMEKNSNGDGILQIIYRWKALTEENSLKQLVSEMIFCASLASRKKRVR
jgi:hypothetical protein